MRWYPLRFKLSDINQARRKRLENWHPWFAWRPVMITGDNTVVWLETIERRKPGGSFRPRYRYQGESPGIICQHCGKKGPWNCRCVD